MLQTSDQNIPRDMDQWGYYLRGRLHERSPGYQELLVAIRDIPTEMHYDPEELSAPVVDSTGRPRQKKFRIPSRIDSGQKICLGHILLLDRREKELEFFTFGGTLTVISEDDEEVVYRIRSEAPILPLTTGRVGEEIPAQLASEAEALLGEARAEWKGDNVNFACRLVREGPMRLYIAIINSVLVRFEDNRNLRDMYEDFYAALREEKRWLQKTGQWPSSRPTVQQLLQRIDG